MIAHFDSFPLNDQELMSQIHPFAKHAYVNNQFGLSLSKPACCLNRTLTLMKTTLNPIKGILRLLQCLQGIFQPYTSPTQCTRFLQGNFALNGM